MYRVVSRTARRLARQISSARAQAWLYGIGAAVGVFSIDGSTGTAFIGYSLMATCGSLACLYEVVRTQEGY